MITIIGGDGKEYGPVPLDQVRRWIAEGRATLDTQARLQGETALRRLGDFAEFAPAAPPPLTGQEKVSSVHAPVFTVNAETSGELVLAARGVRLAAALIDGFLSILFAMPGLIMMALHLVSQGGSMPNLEEIKLAELGMGFQILLVSMFILTVIQTWMLTLRGQTIGKRLMKIRIVRCSDDSHPGFVRTVMLRTWVPALIINYVPSVLKSLPWIGILIYVVDVCFIFRPDRRCLHDHLADTKVVEL